MPFVLHRAGKNATFALMFTRSEHFHTENKYAFIYVYRNGIEEELQIQSVFLHLAVLNPMRNRFTLVR
jgi:hypothetical protein